MYQPPTIIAGDLTTTLVTKYNNLVTAIKPGTFTIKTGIIDATQAQDHVLLAAQAGQYVQLTQVMVIVWSQEANPSPVLPQISIGTNTLANNFISATTLAHTVRQVQLMTLPTLLSDVNSQALRLKVIPSSYAEFRLQVWVEGRLVGNGTA